MSGIVVKSGLNPNMRWRRVYDDNVRKRVKKPRDRDFSHRITNCFTKKQNTILI